MSDFKIDPERLAAWNPKRGELVGPMTNEQMLRGGGTTSFLREAHSGCGVPGCYVCTGRMRPKTQ